MEEEDSSLCLWADSLGVRFPQACGLVAGPDLPLGGCSQHHFERLGSNEVPGSDTN
jgi:hypothetical protein